VYKHSCEEDGVFTSFFVNLTDHCTENQKVSCCSVEEENDGCCDDEETIIQTQQDLLTNDYQVSWHLFEIPVILKSSFSDFDFVSIRITRCTTNLGNDPPPILSGRSICIQNQVFRI
jgi:hypothetical protein